MVPICSGPKRGRRPGAHRTIEADSEAGDLPVLKVVLLGFVIRKGFLALGSSSRPVVAGMAYRP